VTETDDLALAKAWIAEQHARKSGGAFDTLADLLGADPERCWRIIVKIFEEDQSDWLLSNLAAGPIEDLLARHGEHFIARIETMARQVPRFRVTIQGVWRNSISAAVWARLRKAANLDP
jgi:hypothetical protein